jgi:hypothetical protein
MLVCGCDYLFLGDPPPDPGRIQVRLTVTKAAGYPELTVECRGRWLQKTEGSTGTAPAGLEMARLDLDAGSVFEGQTVVLDELEGLRAGLWELVISGVAGGSDVFVPGVCRQEVFAGKVIDVEVIEGQVGCASDMGGEPPPAILWGTAAATSRPLPLTQGEARAFPTVAQQGGDAARLYLLLRQGATPQTRPGQAPVLLGAFYQDQAGQPGAMVSGEFTLEVIPPLEFRERLNKVNPPDPTTWTLTGDTWVWFDIGPVSLQAGQTLHLGLLDPCPGPGTCPQQDFLLFYTGQAARSFRATTGATALPNPFAGTPTTTNAAPLAALAVTR